MKMLLLPAIDLREGQCVCLYQGKLKETMVLSKDPVKVAQGWEAMGAKMLHLVDLDGAFSGSPKNLQVVKKIVSTIKIPVQLGGGIRSLDTIEKILALGVSRIILGTAAINNPTIVEQAVAKHGADAIIVGVDSKYGKVAVEGWETVVEKTVIDFVKTMQSLGIERIVYTDVRRDGTLKGLNFGGIKELAKKTSLKIIASGGVASIDDLKALLVLKDLGVEGLIIGRALYTGDFDLVEALEIAKG